jgi:hypothetical protein
MMTDVAGVTIIVAVGVADIMTIAAAGVVIMAEAIIAVEAGMTIVAATGVADAIMATSIAVIGDGAIAVAPPSWFARAIVAIAGIRDSAS